MIELTDIPIFLLLCGICFFLSGILFIYLSSRQNPFAQEVSYLSACAMYVTLEIAFGIFSELLTIPIIVLVFLLTSYEAMKPIDGTSNNQPMRVNESDGELLWFKVGKEYRAVTAFMIQAVPLDTGTSWKSRLERIEDEPQLWKEIEELRWLMPLWEEGESPSITYTFDAKLERGLVSLYVFLSAQGKKVDNIRGALLRAQIMVDTWLTRKGCEHNVMIPDEVWKEYLDLSIAFEFELSSHASEQIIGFLSIDGVPLDPTNDIASLIQGLSNNGIYGHLHLTFQADRLPRSRKPVRDFQTDGKVRIPHKVESHHMRELYKELNEVEVSEGTGSFCVCTYLLVENRSSTSFHEKMNRIGGIVRGMWSGVRVAVVPTRMLHGSSFEILTRAHLKRSVQVSGARLASLLHLSNGLPGVESRVTPPEFSLPRQIGIEGGTSEIGTVLQHGRGTPLTLNIPIDQYVHDVGIFGNPGSGKTNTAFQIVNEVSKSEVPFLVITPSKREWRLLANHISDVRIFPTRSIRFNFLHVPDGVHVSTHINNVTNCFTAWWPSEGIIVEHVTKVFQRAYINAGWDLYTGEGGDPILLEDLYEAMEEVAGHLKYGANLKKDFLGALSARFETLINEPVLSVMFNCEQGLSVTDLLNHNTILELNDLPDQHKALVTSLLLVSVTEYLEANTTVHKLQNKLRHLLVLEEAHHVLKNVARTSHTEGHSSQQQAIDTIIQLLRESRGLGLGIVIVDQLPAMLAPEAVKLVGTMVIHSIFDANERVLVGSRANLSDEQLGYIGHLKCGEAIVHQGLHGAATHVQVRKFDTTSDSTSPAWTDEQVRNHMTDFYLSHPHLLEVNIPVVSTWKPDETLLSNLSLMIDTDGFLEEFTSRLDSSEALARSFLRNIVQKVAARLNADILPSEIDFYVDFLRESIKEKMQSPAAITTTEEVRRKTYV